MPINISTRRLILFIVLSVLCLGLIAYFALAFVIELWWFDTLDLATFFIRRESYRGLIVFSATVVTAALIFINFMAVSARVKRQIFNTPREQQPIDNTPHPFNALSVKFILPVSLLLTLPILLPVYDNPETFLLYLFGAPSTLTDPVYGRDISYYLFSFPAYTLIQKELLLTFSLMLAATALLYWYAYLQKKDQLNGFPKSAKAHLTALIIAIVIIQAWGIFFEKTELLYIAPHDPVFFGPGFVAMNYELPLIWLTFFTFLSAAGSAIYFIHTHRGGRWLMGIGIAFLVLTGVRQLSFIPGLIDQFYIQPNPVRSEKPYIQFNIDATLDAFDLQHVEKIEYPAVSTLTDDLRLQIDQDLDNIPLWDHALLQKVLEQLQAIRPYYSFSPVTVDRYELGDQEYQVDIAARELTLAKLPTEALSWENIHMKYTHGYGVAASPAAQQGGQPIQWFINGLSLQTPYRQLEINTPQIYFGLADYPYAIVPNAAPRPTNGGNFLISDYRGSGGLKMSSLLKKLSLAAFLNDINIPFSASVTRQSKILLRRNIIERVRAIAPFLQLDSSPYPVVVDKKIYWIIDAYTTSDRYPYVKTIDTPLVDSDGEPVSLNYIRNSVKIVVDAYDGSVDFYIVDTSDPIVNTLRRIFPTVFKPLSAIPKGFIRHLSYPQDLFTLQMAIYARYHQTNPDVFYQQSEDLEPAKMDDKPVDPYYLTLDILDRPDKPESEAEKFILVAPLSPIGRDNLQALAIAGCLNIENCNQQYAADLYVYFFPQSVQIDGPSQIAALIDQNPEIARYITLWDQRGSKVIKGRMLIIPVETSILYIQPVYLIASTKTGFPQLAKVIVAMNQRTAMGDTIEEAFHKLVP